MKDWRQVRGLPGQLSLHVLRTKPETAPSPGLLSQQAGRLSSWANLEALGNFQGVELPRRPLDGPVQTVAVALRPNAKLENNDRHSVEVAKVAESN